MYRPYIPLIVFIIVLFFCLTIESNNDIWISGYYAGWQQNTLRPTEIEFEGLTHLIHFSFYPVLASKPNRARAYKYGCKTFQRMAKCTYTLLSG